MNSHKYKYVSHPARHHYSMPMLVRILPNSPNSSNNASLKFASSFLNKYKYTLQ